MKEKKIRKKNKEWEKENEEQYRKIAYYKKIFHHLYTLKHMN